MAARSGRGTFSKATAWLLLAVTGGALSVAAQALLYPDVAGRIELLILLTTMFGALFTRTSRSRLAVSAFIAGFASAMAILPADYAPVECMPGSGPCPIWSETVWNTAIIGGIVLAIALVVAATRPRSRRPLPELRGPTVVARDEHHAHGLRSGRALIDDIERRLGMLVLVRDRLPGQPVTITATLVFGGRHEDVSVTGPTEADAWRQLAERATAWRLSDEMHVAMWGGGF